MKIFLIGWFGAGNIGDEAILLAELYAMKDRIKDVEFHVISFNAGRTRGLTAGIPQVVNIIGVGSKHRFLKTDFTGLWKSLKDVDVVVVGGGGIFQDLYNHYPIPFFTTMIILSKLMNKKVVLYSVGIGPVRTWIGKRLCRFASNLADNVTVRDAESRNILISLGVEKNIEVYPDPVFLLEPARTERVERLFVNNCLTNGLRIGVSVQDLFFWSDENKKVLAETLDHFIINKGAKVIFIPFGSYKDGWFHKRSSDYVDLSSSKRLASMMIRESVIIDEELNPQELLSFIRGMDLIISMRLHGLIMGISMNVPVIGLTYQQEIKVANLMNRMGLKENLFMADELCKERLLKQIESILSNKEYFRLYLRKQHSILAKEAERGLGSLLKMVEDDETLQKAVIS